MVEQRIAALHLVQAILQRLKRPLGVGDHRREQVGHVVVQLELHDLGIDQQQAYLFRRAREQDGADQRVDQHRLAGSGGAGDQQVRGGGEIDHLRLAGDVLAEGDGNAVGQRPGRRAEILQTDQIAEPDYGAVAVRHLDADRVLARDRRHDAHPRGGQPQRDVVGQVDDAGDFDARRRQDLEHGDHRPAAYAGDLGVDAELRQGGHQRGGGFAGVVLHLPRLVRLMDIEHFHRHLVAAASGAPGASRYRGRGRGRGRIRCRRCRRCRGLVLHGRFVLRRRYEERRRHFAIAMRAVEILAIVLRQGGGGFGFGFDGAIVARRQLHAVGGFGAQRCGQERVGIVGYRVVGGRRLVRDRGRGRGAVGGELRLVGVSGAVGPGRTAIRVVPGAVAIRRRCIGIRRRRGDRVARG